jgi:hypothetical protein
MDMFTSVTPPFINFLRGNSLTGISSVFSTAYRRPQSSELDSSLSKPLISETSLDKEEEPTYTLPVKSSASSYSKFSISEFPPPQEQCSFAQAVINGKNLFPLISRSSRLPIYIKSFQTSLSFAFFFPSPLLDRCTRQMRLTPLVPECYLCSFL